MADEENWPAIPVGKIHFIMMNMRVSVGVGGDLLLFSSEQDKTYDLGIIHCFGFDRIFFESPVSSDLGHTAWRTPPLAGTG